MMVQQATHTTMHAGSMGHISLRPEALKAWADSINAALRDAGKPELSAHAIEQMTTKQRFDTRALALRDAAERSRLVEERGVFVDATPAVDGQECMGENDDAE